MMGHVIRREKVANQGSCRVMCYIEPNCMSLNIGPLIGGLHKCELNNATDENPSTLHEEMDYIYLEIEVNVLQSDSFGNLGPMWVYALFVNRHISFVSLSAYLVFVFICALVTVMHDATACFGKLEYTP